MPNVTLTTTWQKLVDDSESFYLSFGKTARANLAQILATPTEDDFDGMAIHEFSPFEHETATRLTIGLQGGHIYGRLKDPHGSITAAVTTWVETP